MSSHRLLIRTSGRLALFSLGPGAFNLPTEVNFSHTCLRNL